MKPRKDKTSKDKVAVIMGSQSDSPVMGEAAKILKLLGVAVEMKVVSAHRTPEFMQTFAKKASARGIKVIIAGAGGAAHLPGMVASLTSLPVIGVPVSINQLNGLDSLLSIVQMPKGVPVATVAIDNAHNAGLLAARILATHDPKLAKKLDAVRISTRQSVLKSQKTINVLLKKITRLSSKR
jgi:phosphoribosylaminoimidazole carboxylase PurE protein